MQPDLPARLLDGARRSRNVSGRGVGMDVVKTNIEKIGGTVDVQSRRGHGTTLRIKIPLTLAIIPALIVTSGGDRYAIPQVSLLELVRLEGRQARDRIEIDPRRAGLPPARQPAAAGLPRTASLGDPERRTRRERPDGRSTSSSCRPTTATSAWSSTRSTTPRRSSSSRSASS